MASVSMGEVRDRRLDSEDLGQGVVSSWNPLLGTWIGTPAGPNWVPVPQPDYRRLKLQEGDALKKTLLSDASRILEGAGISVAVTAPSSREKPPPLRVNLEILDVTASSKGDVRTFLDKGMSIVSFGFSAALVDPKTGIVLWQGWFGRKESMETRYYTGGKYEEALNRVYRKALADFGKEAAAGLFLTAIRD